MTHHTSWHRIATSLAFALLAVPISFIAACTPRPSSPPPAAAQPQESATATITLNLSATPTVTSNITVPGTIDEARQTSVNAAQPSRHILLDSGRVLFQACAICHGGNGRGGRGPEVANSDYVQGDRTRLIRTVLEGVKQPIHVNGVRWKTGEMLGWGETWNDFKIAAVLTYIRVALNDSTVTSCIPEDIETGTWASCTLVPRDSSEIATDSISVREVAEVRGR